MLIGSAEYLGRLYDGQVPVRTENLTRRDRFNSEQGYGRIQLDNALPLENWPDSPPGLIVMDGALPIRAAGSLIGAIGVSGAPGGEKDAACAAAALKKLEERLEFAQ